MLLYEMKANKMEVQEVEQQDKHMVRFSLRHRDINNQFIDLKTSVAPPSSIHLLKLIYESIR
jgi:hypothetical protein